MPATLEKRYTGADTDLLDIGRRVAERLGTIPPRTKAEIAELNQLDRWRDGIFDRDANGNVIDVTQGDASAATVEVDSQPGEGIHAITTALHTLYDATQNHFELAKRNVEHEISKPPERWFLALAACIGAFASNMHELTTRRQFILVQQMNRACEKLLKYEDQSGNSWQSRIVWDLSFFTEQLQGVFSSMEELDIYLAFPKAKTIQLESVRELIDQKLSDQQICVAYDWKDEAGDWDMNRVRAARLDPDSEPRISITKPADGDGLPTRLPSGLAIRALAEAL